MPPWGASEIADGAIMKYKIELSNRDLSVDGRAQPCLPGSWSADAFVNHHFGAHH
jgi:hypothetical protein